MSGKFVSKLSCSPTAWSQMQEKRCLGVPEAAGWTVRIDQNSPKLKVAYFPGKFTIIR